MHLDIPVIGILRGVDSCFFEEILPAAFDAGLSAIEVTINTAKAEQMISANRSRVPRGKYLGMGTIRNLHEARQAIAAGAMFLVTPNLDLTVIEFANLKNVPIIPGAFTPTEVYEAWSAGAKMIKVFLCNLLGPRYIKDLLGLFEQIRLMAVGGINSENAAEYFSAGVAAVGVGPSLFGLDALKEKNIEKLKENIKLFIQGG